MSSTNFYRYQTGSVIHFALLVVGKQFKELPRKLQRWIKSGRAETKRKSGPVRVLTAEEINALYPHLVVTDRRVSSAKTEPTQSTISATVGLTIGGGRADEDCPVADRSETGGLQLNGGASYATQGAVKRTGRVAETQQNSARKPIRAISMTNRPVENVAAGIDPTVRPGPTRTARLTTH